VNTLVAWASLMQQLAAIASSFLMVSSPSATAVTTTIVAGVGWKGDKVSFVEKGQEMNTSAPSHR